MVKSDSQYTMTIGGRGVVGASSFNVLNPANEEVVGLAPNCSRDQLEEAVAAARKAFPAWKATPYAERQRLVAQVGKVLASNIDALRRLLTAEQGKTLDGAAADVMGGAFWCQSIASLVLPVTINEDSPTRRSETRHVPLGVVGAIAPWNFPILLACFKIAPALLAGNTVILKPSPFTPLTTLRIGELLRDVLPPGVLNVVSGGDDLGPWMTSHKGIDKISFTGSSQTGRKVMASAAFSLKRITLELGGNDAAIVLPDIDVQKTAQELFWAAFGNSGQICIAVKRMYVHKDVYEPLKEALVAYAKTVKVGDGSEQGIQLGPIQNRLQYQRVIGLIQDAKEKGYKFLMGGIPEADKGYFVPVTILDNPPEESRIVQEEQFGPVLPLIEFEDVDDAIVRANASEYGLGASVWSADEEKARAIAVQLSAGTVWINEAQHLSPFAAFGGHKQSGVGVENGLEGLLEYTAVQTITLKKKAANVSKA
jgi:acyl-CoA reductase-like NAD-dependent aldehyde dehydrogenase